MQDQPLTSIVSARKYSLAVLAGSLICLSAGSAGLGTERRGPDGQGTEQPSDQRRSNERLGSQRLGSQRPGSERRHELGATNETRHREGSLVTDKLGVFQLNGARALFRFADNSSTIQVLENLALERVVRTMDEIRTDRYWSVSGSYTEYRGENFLLLQRAVLTSKSLHPVAAPRTE